MLLKTLIKLSMVVALAFSGWMAQAQFAPALSGKRVESGFGVTTQESEYSIALPACKQDLRAWSAYAGLNPFWKKSDAKSVHWVDLENDARCDLVTSMEEDEYTPVKGWPLYFGFSRCALHYDPKKKEFDSDNGPLNWFGCEGGGATANTIGDIPLQAVTLYFNHRLKRTEVVTRPYSLGIWGSSTGVLAFHLRIMTRAALVADQVCKAVNYRETPECVLMRAFEAEARRMDSTDFPQRQYEEIRAEEEARYSRKREASKGAKKVE